MHGWGAYCEGMSTGGSWINTEKNWHINALELKSILLSLMSIVKDHGIHVKVFSDSTTAIACINKLGTSHSELCHHITKQIWEWAEKKDIHITAAHIPGHKNINADRESRELSYDLEWMLCPKILHKALKILKFNPEADMFASNINYQFHTYFSYKADPKAKAVDSFTVSWHSLKFYAFPPFSIISRTLKKIKAEKAEGILVVPYWPNQVWFPVLFKMLIDIPILITSRKNLLKLPQYPELVHPMWRKIDIVVCHLAGSSQKAMEFQRKLKTYWKHHGDRQQGKSMLGIYSDSHSVVINGMLIPFRQPPK